MGTRHTISEAAAQTGFTASALRFYEDAGLVAPGRSEAGYRLYDDRAIERLQFISRLKQLGLTLDEIAGLVTFWDRDPCSTVAAQLARVVDERIDLAQHRIAELVALTTELRGARAALSAAGDGSCGAGCACQRSHADARSPGAPSPRASHPVDAPPIVCTLGAADFEDRIGAWQALLARASSRRAVHDGIEVEFPADTGLAAEVAHLAAAEQRCCSFFTFALRLDHRGTTMTVTGPPEVAELITAGFGPAA